MSSLKYCFIIVLPARQVPGQEAVFGYFFRAVEEEYHLGTTNLLPMSVRPENKSQESCLSFHNRYLTQPPGEAVNQKRGPAFSHFLSEASS